MDPGNRTTIIKTEAFRKRLRAILNAMMVAPGNFVFNYYNKIQDAHQILAKPSSRFISTEGFFCQPQSEVDAIFITS